MKKPLGALIAGLALIAVTLLLFFTIATIADTTLETIHILGLSFILLSEVITMLYGAFAKDSPRRKAAVLVSSAMIPGSVFMTFIYSVLFPDSITVFVLLHCIGFIVCNLFAYYLMSFDVARGKEDKQVQDAKGNMLMLRKMVKVVMADPAAAPYEARLMALEEELHFSNDSVITASDNTIRQMLLMLQQNIADPTYDVEGQITRIEKAVQTRKILASTNL